MKTKFFALIMILAFVLSACAAPAPVATEVPAAPETAYPAEEKPAEEATEAPTADATGAPADEATEAYPVEATEIRLTDALGREVVLPDVPARVALIGKGVFMVADAVYTFPETDELVTAVAAMNQKSSKFLSMIDVNWEEKAEIDKSAGPEQIAALQPDCVIMKTTNQELGAQLETLQIPVVYLDFETPEQYARDLGILGQVFQNPERAMQLVDYFGDRTEAVSAVTNGIDAEKRPTTLLLDYSVNDGTVAFKVAPSNWMQTMMVEMAGGKPIWTDIPLDKSWTVVNLEQVAAWNPEVIIVTTYADPIDEVIALLKADPQWQELEAVKNGKLYGMAGDVYSWDQPDTRWTLGLNWMAATLHPDLFPDYDIVEDAKEFYQVLYEMDDAAFEQNILPLLETGK